jgi:hypothetical protein
MVSGNNEMAAAGMKAVIYNGGSLRLINGGNGVAWLGEKAAKAKIKRKRINQWRNQKKLAEIIEKYVESLANQCRPVIIGERHRASGISGITLASTAKAHVSVIDNISQRTYQWLKWRISYQRNGWP